MIFNGDYYQEMSTCDKVMLFIRSMNWNWGCCCWKAATVPTIHHNFHPPGWILPPLPSLLYPLNALQLAVRVVIILVPLVIRLNSPYNQQDYWIHHHYDDNFLHLPWIPSAITWLSLKKWPLHSTAASSLHGSVQDEKETNGCKSAM